MLKRFESLDTDKDGKLSKSELEAHAREVRQKIFSRFGGMHRPGAEGSKTESAKDHDGTKSKEEPKKSEPSKNAPKEDAPKTNASASLESPASAEIPEIVAVVADVAAIAELSP